MYYSWPLDYCVAAMRYLGCTHDERELESAITAAARFDPTHKGAYSTVRILPNMLWEQLILRCPECVEGAKAAHIGGPEELEISFGEYLFGSRKNTPKPANTRPLHPCTAEGRSPSI